MNQGVSEERLDDRLGELKNWIESELLHKLIEGESKSELQGCPVDTVHRYFSSLKLRPESNQYLAKRQKPEPKPIVEPFHHDTELRDENALRLLIENKFRTALENRKPKPVVDKPRVIREISIDQKSSPDSTNSISSVYKPLQARIQGD